jgi:hypothetical protein
MGSEDIMLGQNWLMVGQVKMRFEGRVVAVMSVWNFRSILSAGYGYLIFVHKITRAL